MVETYQVTDPQTGEVTTYAIVDFDQAVRDITEWLRKEVGVPEVITTQDVPLRGMASPPPHKQCIHSPFFTHVHVHSPETKGGKPIRQCLYCRVPLLLAAKGEYVPKVTGTTTGRLPTTRKDST